MIQDMNDPAWVQAVKGRQLFSLMERCRKTGLWDGLVRNGYVTREQRARVAHLSPDVDVQEQLFLQYEAGKLKIPTY